MVGDHYEVKVDGQWTPVPMTRSTTLSRRMVVRMFALPEGLNKGVLFCVVLPLEG
jgi:hypothetical protein